MRLAFAIFRYFPFGGLQGDMLRFALCASGHGCEVVIFCDRWSGEKPDSPGVTVRELPVRRNSLRTLRMNRTAST